jgi:hypothetical protein
VHTKAKEIRAAQNTSLSARSVADGCRARARTKSSTWQQDGLGLSDQVKVNAGRGGRDRTVGLKHDIHPPLVGEIFSAPTRDEKLKPRNKSGSVKAVR